MYSYDEIKQALCEMSISLNDEQIDKIVQYAQNSNITIQDAICDIMLIGQEEYRKSCTDD